MLFKKGGGNVSHTVAPYFRVAYRVYAAAKTDLIFLEYKDWLCIFITRSLYSTTERLCRILHNHSMVSSANSKMDKNSAFTARFIEACGTAEPSGVQRLLNISYQAAKNYLHGRLPQTEILIKIAERTSCSIDWLLTGRGKKFLDGASQKDTPVSTGQFEELVRRVKVEVINEISGSQNAGGPKIVRLQPSELMSEKVLDEVETLTGSQP